MWITGISRNSPTRKQNKLSIGGATVKLPCFRHGDTLVGYSQGIIPQVN